MVFDHIHFTLISTVHFARNPPNRQAEGLIEKQAEDPLPLGGGMNAAPTAIEL